MSLQIPLLYLGKHRQILWMLHNTKFSTVLHSGVHPPPNKSIVISGSYCWYNVQIYGKATDSSGNTSPKYDSVMVRTGVRSDAVQVRSIVISTLGDTVNFQVGDTLKLIVTISPEKASNKKIKWLATDEGGSATIGEETGIVTATKAGMISVEAIATDSLAVASLPFKLNIQADTVKVRSITISTETDTANFEVGDSIIQGRHSPSKCFKH